MKKLLFLGLFVSQIHPTEWIGNVNPGLYTDTNITVTGDCTLAATTTIWAQNNDVTITIAETAKIYSSNTVDATLVLRATAPYTITILVNHSVKFGGVGGVLFVPLMIVVEGDTVQNNAGTIQWHIAEGAKVTFGSGSDRSGTILQINVINNAGTIITPTHIFKPSTSYADQIIFDRHCKLLYAFSHASSEFILPPFRGLTFDAFEANTDHRTFIEFQESPTFTIETVQLMP
ncbi:hypothetical protein IPH25_04155 [bacterium]|nr:MAG: hypothetical protein IPG37_01150 [bacterium]QQR61640.1 MAG: hypothetical protein IPH25_04155 [bacterium]QQR62795.1 MAG: hypothetical protein IPH67_05305 [bacterium]